ncbi:MAG: flippase-like domain-containing protein [Anaerolineae bacterium]|nr:flippase-like domain-containing protein [Anaerolineae bacterium]
MTTTAQQNRRWVLPLVGVLITLFIFYLIFTQVNLGAFAAALRQARYIYAVPALLMLLVGLGARALRWRALLGNRFPLIRAFSIMNIAYMMNALLPFRMGEAARAYLVSRGEGALPIFQTVSSIIVERLLDVLALVVVIGLALASGPLPAEIQTAGVFTTIMSVVGFLVLVLLSRQRALAQQMLAVTFRLLSRFAGQKPTLQEKLSRWLNHFLDGLQPLTDPALLFRAVGYTAVSWILSLWAGYFLLGSFFPDATWSATFLYIAASSLAIAVPAAPGNLGPFELSILLALNASGYGDARDTVIAFALFVHGVYLVINVATGLVGLVSEGISLRQLY